MVAALLRTVFAQDNCAECHQQRRLVADQLREKYPKIATLMDNSEDEVQVLTCKRRRTGSVMAVRRCCNLHV
ncbi:transposase [Pseudomonas asplenii]|uniref:transposase n=1 Tax=Pseudomonas asplenii TaxID=53407 RepID=UPI0004196E42